MSRLYFPRSLGRIGRAGGRLWAAIRRWPLWSQSRQVLAVLFLVEILAIVLTIATSTQYSIDREDWLTGAVLAMASIAHMETARSIERIRETLRADAPYIDLKSVWAFAAVILLPLPLAVSLVVMTHVHLRWRVVHSPIFRWTYSAATVVLATHAAAAVLQAGLPIGVYPGLPTGWQGVSVVILAGLIRWFVNHGLVAMIILVASPQTPGRTALGSFGAVIIELSGVSLGGVAALVAATDPWYVLLIMPPLLLLHRSLLLHHYELAARTDEKTRLANAMHWSEMARRELSRAARDDTSVGILMIDLDHFKRVNDTHGHLAGDAVLKAVADAIRKESRDYDLAGRFGGEEFVLLLPGITTENLLARAERLRDRIKDLKVHTMGNNNGRIEIADLTASIGAVTYPAGGAHLDNLLLAVDAALYEAKRTGRNRTCLAHQQETNGSVPQQQSRNPEQTGLG
jgi:diguanylate cyclase (GGDEF)-like protein